MKVHINKPIPVPQTYDLLGLTEEEMWEIRFALLGLGQGNGPKWAVIHDALASPMDGAL